MSAGPLVVTYPLTGRSRAIVAEELAGAAEIVYLADLVPADREEALRRAGALLAHDTSKELRPDEIPLIRNARLLQFTAAGIDWVPLRELPPELPVAANKGGGAEPMSEHIVALALAAAKRLFVEHDNLKRGEFNQRSSNKILRGGVCGILGFGNVGAATARLMRAFGMQIHAINRRGASDEPTDWIATPDRLDELLRVSDVFVVCRGADHRDRRADRRPRTRADAGGRDLHQRGPRRDRRRGGALCAPEGPSALLRRHRRVVGRTGAARKFRDGIPVSRPAERDRLTA